jgi:catechol 2,3-dioxygenase-like lactoylglutathione lyase family enzyme
VESLTPVLGSARPVLRVDSYEKAVEHYVGWLGFTLDWDWREAPGTPCIASFSRDGVSFMINEHPDTLGPTQIHIPVKNFDALVDEWNGRRPGSAEPRIAPPYEFPDLPIEDPFGNVLVFEGPDEAARQSQRDTVMPKMREYVQRELDAGNGFPTPEQVREAIGPPLGLAIEVLNEFPEYGAAYEERRAATRDVGNEP